MTELINKEELLRRFADFGQTIPKDQVFGVIASVKEDIVRCKECKRAEKRSCPFNAMGLGYTDDDFCSYGERNE